MVKWKPPVLSGTNLDGSRVFSRVFQIRHLTFHRSQTIIASRRRISYRIIRIRKWSVQLAVYASFSIIYPKWRVNVYRGGLFEACLYMRILRDFLTISRITVRYRVHFSWIRIFINNYVPLKNSYLIRALRPREGNYSWRVAWYITAISQK